MLADDETGSHGKADDPASRRYLTSLGIEDRWAPLTGRDPGGAPPVGLRRRWLAALAGFALLALFLYLLS